MRSSSQPGPTVIVPSCSSGPALVATVRSALAQRAPGLQVLVLDDGSADDGVADLVPLRDPRLRVVCQPPRGLAATLDLGLSLADTRWASVLLPGDRLLADWSDRMLGAAAGGDDVRVVAPCDEADLADPFLPDLIGRNPLPFSGTLFDRTAALRAGGFDPMLRATLDLDLWLRLLPGGRVVAAGRPLVVVDAERVEFFDPERLEAERAYVVDKALACVSLHDWWSGASVRPASDADAMLELALRLSRSGCRALLGSAADLLARAIADGATPPESEDVARLLRRQPGVLRARQRAHGASVAPPTAEQTSAAERALRVAFEVSTLDRGGLESVVARLALGLRSRGIVPTVVCTRAGGREAERLSAAGIDVVVLTGSEAERARQYERILAERGIDVLNAHFSNVGVPIAERLGIPLVVTLHNAYTWLGSSPLDEFRRVDGAVAGYVAVSQSVADFTTRRFAVDPARIVVIRNGTELHPFEDRAAARAALGIPDDRVVLVQVGRIDPIKSQLALVAAMKRLAPQRPELLAWIVGGVGSASYALRVQRAIAREGLAGAVALVGERDDVPRILAAADLLVMPSAIEGLSLAAVEAMSAGLPVVLTRTGDAEWLLGEGQHAGALIDGPAVAAHVDGDALNRELDRDEPAHAARLADAVAAVLADLPRMRERARARAAELAPLLSLDRQLDAHAELFEAVAAGGGADGARALRRGARADAACAADAHERAQALADSVLPLASAQVEELDLLRKAAAIDRSLAAAEVDAEAALDRATRALDKLRISRRVRAALRDLKRRLPGGPGA